MLTISTKLWTAKRVDLNYDYEFMAISWKSSFTICYVSLVIDIQLPFDGWQGNRIPYRRRLGFD